MCLGWFLLWDKSSVYAPYWLRLAQSFKQNVVQSTVNLHHIDCWSIDVALLYLDGFQWKCWCALIL